MMDMDAGTQLLQLICKDCISQCMVVLGIMHAIASANFRHVKTFLRGRDTPKCSSQTVTVTLTIVRI